MGLPEHVVGPLDDQAARTLLHVRAPSMAVLLRRRLLTEAAGNPLALVELPALSASPDSLAEKVVLPLSARLEQAFADRLADAPPETAALLVVFAADVTSSLREVLAAFSDLMTRVRNEQAERLLNNGLAGKYNPVIAKVLLTKHGYVDKVETDLTHHVPQPLLGGAAAMLTPQPDTPSDAV
jgi:hypothetical protein